MLLSNGPSPQARSPGGGWWILIMLIILAGFAVEIWLGLRQLGYWRRHPQAPAHLTPSDYEEIVRLGRQELKRGFLLSFLRYAPLTAFFGFSLYAAGWEWCEQKLIHKYSAHPHRRVKSGAVYFALIVTIWYGVETMATMLAYLATGSREFQALAAELVSMLAPLLIGALSYLSIIPLFAYVSKKLNTKGDDRRTIIYAGLQAYYVLLLVGVQLGWAAWWRWLPLWARFELPGEVRMNLRGLLEYAMLPSRVITTVNLPFMQVWAVGFGQLGSIVIMRGAAMAYPPSALLGLIARAAASLKHGDDIIQLFVIVGGVIILLQCLSLILHSKRIFNALGFPDHPPLLCALLLPFLLQHPIRVLLQPVFNFIRWWSCWQADETAYIMGYGRELMEALSIMAKVSPASLHGDWLVALFTSSVPTIASRLKLLTSMEWVKNH